MDKNTITLKKLKPKACQKDHTSCSSWFVSKNVRIVQNIEIKCLIYNIYIICYKNRMNYKNHDHLNRCRNSSITYSILHDKSPEHIRYIKPVSDRHLDRILLNDEN